MTKVTLKGHIIVPDAQLTAIQKALISHIRLTREEPGCLCFDVEQAVDDKNKFNVYEEFIDATAFNTHQARAASSPWGSISKGLVRDYQVTGIERC